MGPKAAKAMGPSKAITLLNHVLLLTVLFGVHIYQYHLPPGEFVFQYCWFDHPHILLYFVDRLKLLLLLVFLLLPA